MHFANAKTAPQSEEVRQSGLVPGLAPYRALGYVASVSTVAEIKAAIDHLSFEQRCELMALLYPKAADDWDRQMQSDAAEGKFNELMREADEERQSGVLRDFPKP